MRDTSGELLKESPPDPDSIDDKMVFYVRGLAWHLRIECLGLPVLPVHFLTGARDFTYTSETKEGPFLALSKHIFILVLCEKTY